MSDVSIRILLIEDNPADADLFEEALHDSRLESYAVLRQSTLKGGLQTLGESVIDVVLLDLSLPDAFGLEACVRLHGKIPQVPLIVLTGMDDDALAVAAVKAGAQDFLVKGQADGALIGRSIRYAIERKKTEEVSRRALEMEQLVTHEILKHAPIGIAKVDENFVITEMNDALSKYLEQTRVAVVGEYICEVIPTQLEDFIVSGIKQGTPCRREALSVQLERNGQRQEAFWDLTLWPVMSEDNSRRGAVLMVSDVTEHVLRVKQREEFVATLAHDLKVPLVGADRALSLLLNGCLGDLSAQHQHILSMLKDSNQDVLQMVQNLLEIYRCESESAPFHFDVVDLKSLIRTLVDEVKQDSRSQGLLLTSQVADNLCRISADYNAIRRLITNLLDNAIKFATPGCSIEVSARNVADQVLIKVQDTGKGIAPEDLRRLFERYWQSEESTKYPASLGVGLYLCRQIAEAHNGRISCTSREGEGTTVSVILPALSEARVVPGVAL